MGAMGLSIKNARLKKIDTRFDFFSTKKKVDQKNQSPIPIPKSPKIPKIILRTCDHFKNTKNQEEKGNFSKKRFPQDAH